jgi:hypothetical protein
MSVPGGQGTDLYLPGSSGMYQPSIFLSGVGTEFSLLNRFFDFFNGFFDGLMGI